MENQAEKSEDLDCQEPAFHHPHRGPRRHHYEVEEPPVPMFRPIVSDPEDYDDYEDDYDFIAPFNGNNAENNENDLVPRTFEDLKKKPKKKQPVKKPIEETSRQPNSPWLSLATMMPATASPPNDINFDVDDKFKFRMPTSENFKGRDVKFNVKLPQDLIGGHHQ